MIERAWYIELAAQNPGHHDEVLGPYSSAEEAMKQWTADTGSALPEAATLVCRPKPEIERVLVLSTAHLPERLGSEGLSSVEGVAADKLHYGWLVWVADEADMDDVPAEDRAVLSAIFDFAREHGVDRIRFDCDTDMFPGLRTFEW